MRDDSSTEIRTWYCGAARCQDVIRGGDAEKQAHLTEKHPDLFGLIFVPVEGR